MRVPLAWLNLMHDKKRLLIALGGISFAVLLMLMQVGFQGALLDSTTALPRALQADLIIKSRMRYALLAIEAFPERQLVQAAAVEGVASVEPLYLKYTLYNHPAASRHGRSSGDLTMAEQKVSSIRLLAFDPDRVVLDLPGLTAMLPRLRSIDTVLIDSASKEEQYGPLEAGVQTEIAGQHAEVVGTFRLGTDFVNDGNLITATRNLNTFAPVGFGEPQATQQVDLGLVRVTPGEDPIVVRDRLREQFASSDLDIITRDELIAKEQAFWLSSTPIGSVFNIGLGIGFVVGAIICYQVLFSGLASYMAEFATLKAMGYSDRYFYLFVAQQSVILSVLGFIPGVIISYFLYQILGQQTGLPLELTFLRAGFVLLLTNVMCMISGMVAVRKVLAADPASLFK